MTYLGSVYIRAYMYFIQHSCRAPTWWGNILDWLLSPEDINMVLMVIMIAMVNATGS